MSPSVAWCNSSSVSFQTSAHSQSLASSLAYRRIALLSSQIRKVAYLVPWLCFNKYWALSEVHGSFWAETTTSSDFVSPLCRLRRLCCQLCRRRGRRCASLLWGWRVRLDRRLRSECWQWSSCRLEEFQNIRCFQFWWARRCTKLRRPGRQSCWCLKARALELAQPRVAKLFMLAFCYFVLVVRFDPPKTFLLQFILMIFSRKYNKQFTK